MKRYYMGGRGGRYAEASSLWLGLKEWTKGLNLTANLELHEEQAAFLRSLSCPIDVQVRRERCGNPFVLSDVVFLDKGDDYFTIELTPEQAAGLAEFLQSNGWEWQWE